MSLASRIAEARLEKGITEPAELGRLVKITAAAVYAWESGKTKSLKGEVLIKLAEVLDVHPRWLMTGKGPKREGPAWTAPKDIDELPTDHVRIEHLAGFDMMDGPRFLVLPKLVVHHKIADTPLEYVRWIVNPSPAMSPVIKQGDLILVDTRFTTLQSAIDDCIYAYRLFERPDVRRIKIRDEHHISVIGHGKGAPLTDIYKDNLHRLEIGGRVLGIS